MKEYSQHPISELFPIMPAAEMKAFVEDVKAHGLQCPITLYEGKILDGRHRYEACGITGVKPRFEEYKGDNPLAFVMSANFKRRHMTDSQRAMVVAKSETFDWGGDRKSAKANQDANVHLDRAERSEIAAVSPRTVATASKILDESPKLAEQVSNGKITVHAAAVKLAEKAKEAAPVIDRTGLPIPKECIALWNRSSEVQKFLTQLSEMRGTLRKAQEANDLLWGGLSYSGALADLGRAYTSIEGAKPYAVCPNCSGKLPKNCLCCKGRGMVSQYLWDSTITREDKAMRAKVVEKFQTK